MKKRYLLSLLAVPAFVLSTSWLSADGEMTGVCLSENNPSKGIHQCFDGFTATKCSSHDGKFHSGKTCAVMGYKSKCYLEEGPNGGQPETSYFKNPGFCKKYINFMNSP